MRRLGIGPPNLGPCALIAGLRPNSINAAYYLLSLRPCRKQTPALSTFPDGGEPGLRGDASMNKWIVMIVAALAPVWVFGGPVNVNEADADTIARELRGVGPAKARAIVTYREENGPFETVEDLLKVQGIGPKVLEDNRKDILLEDKKEPEPGDSS